MATPTPGPTSPQPPAPSSPPTHRKLSRAADRFTNERDHPQPQQGQHPGGGDEHRGKAQAGRNRRPEQRPDRIADRGRAARQAVGGTAQLRRGGETDDRVGGRYEDTEKDAEPGAQQQELPDVSDEGLREEEQRRAETGEDEDPP